MVRCAAVRPALVIACGSLVVAAAAGAQGTALVRGVVYDSLISAAPFAGAEVWIEGTNRMAWTDPAGRFELVVPAAGRYTLTFDSPVLDSIGLSASPVVVDIAAGRTATVALGTPGPAAARWTWPWLPRPEPSPAWYESATAPSWRGRPSSPSARIAAFRQTSSADSRSETS